MWSDISVKRICRLICKCYKTNLVKDTKVNFLNAVVLDYFNALRMTGVVIKCFALC